jgi:hypothetical protein
VLDRLDSAARHLPRLQSKSSNFSEAVDDAPLHSPGSAAMRSAAGLKAAELLAASVSRPRTTSPHNLLSAVKAAAWQVRRGCPGEGRKGCRPRR